LSTNYEFHRCYIDPAIGQHRIIDGLPAYRLRCFEKPAISERRCNVDST